MPKTVEEILKEEGVIKPIPQEESGKAKFEEENVNLKKVVMSVEKLQTEVENLKDFKKQNDEITRELTEKIGEIRSLFFQRESLIKETETKVKTIEDIVSDINPSKYSKELDRRKQEILESQARIEKLELAEKELVSCTSGLKQTMQNIKSVENLEKVLNEIQENVSKNRQIKDEIERAAGKSERFYFEMENRIKDFVGLKERIDKIDDMSKELEKSVDSINIRLSGAVSKTDIEDFKKNVNNIISSNREYIESKVKEIGSLLNLPSEEITARVEQLRKRRGEIANLLLSIENQYKKSLISEKTYTEVKQKNENMMRQIEDEISKMQSGQEFSLKDLPSMIRDLEGKSNSLEVRIGEQKRQIDDSLKSIELKLSDYAKESGTKSSQLEDGMKKIENASQSVTKSVEDVNTRLAGFVSGADIEDFKRNVNGMLSSNKDYVDSKVNEMKNDTDKIESLQGGLSNSINDVITKIEGFASRADIDEFKKDISNEASSNKDYIDGKIKEIESSLNLSGSDAKTRIEQLKKRRNDVSNLMINIEEQYKKAFISEKTYDEVKQKNEDMIKQIDEELSQIQNGKSFSLKTLPSIISNLEDKVNALEKKTEDQEKHLDESLSSISSDSKLANIEQAVKVLTGMLNDIIKNIKNSNDKISGLSASLSSYDMRIKFFEVLDGLVRLDNPKEITYYLAALENLIAGMKAANLWDERKESLTLGLLADIAGNWRKYGYSEIAKVFDDEITKIKSPESYKYMLKY